MDQIRANPQSVQYGAALEYAASTVLGLWGDEGELFVECCRIMVAEVNRLCEERNLDNVNMPDVQLSSEFNQLFDCCRGPARRKRVCMVQQLVLNTKNIELESIVTLEQASLFCSPAAMPERPPVELVLEDIERAGRIRGINKWWEDDHEQSQSKL